MQGEIYWCDNFYSSYIPFSLSSLILSMVIYVLLVYLYFFIFKNGNYLPVMVASFFAFAECYLELNISALARHTALNQQYLF